MKKLLPLLVLTLLICGATFSVVADGDHDHAQGTWTGEVVDIACYASHGDEGRGADHAGCAKGCLNKGMPMGLLTDDGTVVLLAADHKDSSAFDSLKDMAGEQAEVTGSMAEKGGMKVVTVTAAKKAA